MAVCLHRVVAPLSGAWVTMVRRIDGITTAPHQ